MRINSGNLWRFSCIVSQLAFSYPYWDQASVLAQLGLLPLGGLPVVGAEGARSVLDRSLRLNALIRRAKGR
jgi:carboxymethylenebutenolidase